MSQRNRIVFAAAALAAVLLLMAPAPSRAAAFREVKLPAAGLVEQLWSWLADRLPGGASMEMAARWEKEGSAIDPMGKPQTTPPPASTAQDDDGR
jgi:hypothetical protein